MALAGDKDKYPNRNLVVVADREAVVISCALSWPMTLGSQLRERDLRRKVKARLERWSPHNIEDAGGTITAYWKRDDFLPKSGTGQFKKGRQVFQFYLHPAEEIAKLAANPKIIAEWRKADGQATD